MNAYYLSIIVATLVGFCVLAWLLLAPIWRFLDREKEVSREWTKESLARRRREHQDQKRQASAQRDRHTSAEGPGAEPSPGRKRTGGDIPPPPRPTPGGDGATASPTRRGGDPQKTDE